MNIWRKALAASTLAAVLAFPGAVLAEESGNMKDMTMLNVDYSKVETVMMKDMELVPLRMVAESIGYKVMWNEADMSVTLIYNFMPSDDMMKDDMMKDDMMKTMSYSVKIYIDKMMAMLNMSDQMLNDAPMIMHDRTYVTKSFVDMYLTKPMMPMMPMMDMMK